MTFDLFLFTAGGMLAAAVLSTRLSARFGAPAMLLFVLIGILAGSSGPGGIQYANYGLTYHAGLVALVVIVFAGGIETELDVLRAGAVPAGLLATVGVVVKMGVVGAAAVWLVGLDWPKAMLLGAILAPTDAAAVFNVVKGVGLPERIRATLEAESGSNDPVSIYLTITFTALAMGEGGDWVASSLGLVLQLGLGGLYGVGGGFAIRALLRRSRLDGRGLYPVLALAGALMVYALSNILGGNGLLAAYVAGVVVGKKPALPMEEDVRKSLDAAAWAAQLVVFLLIGLLVFPDHIPDILPAAVVTSVATVLVGRPMAVAVALAPMRMLGSRVFSMRDYIVLSWGGLKGAVPIILAMYPVLAGYADGDHVFHIVFVTVLLTTTFQGMTLIPVARRLGVLEE